MCIVILIYHEVLLRLLGGRGFICAFLDYPSYLVSFKRQSNGFFLKDVACVVYDANVLSSMDSMNKSEQGS